MPDLPDVEETLSIASLASLLAAPVATAPTQKFLRFRLHLTQSLLIAVDSIVAVQPLTIDQILPVPQMNPAVLGIYNWRGEAIWLVDLAQQIGVGSLADQPSKALMAIVAQLGDQRLGMVVSQINEIEQHNPNTLLLPSPDLFPHRFLSFVKGYFPDDLIDRDQRSAVLNVAAVFQDSALQIHRLNSF